MTQGLCFLKLSTENKNTKRLKTSDVLFLFSFPSTQSNHHIPQLGKIMPLQPQRAKPCKNALLLANESKDSGFQGSVNCSYFSLRQLTKGKKVPIKKKAKQEAEA